MRLRLKNFGKIKEADLELKGITVIAGHNNAGKSTVGKALAAMYNSFTDIDYKIEEARIHKLMGSAWDAIRKESDINLSSLYGEYAIFPNRGFSETRRYLYAETEQDKVDAIEDFIRQVERFVTNIDEISPEKLFTLVQNAFEEASGYPLEKILNQTVSIYFQRVFYNQVNSLYFPGEKATVGVTIKDKNIDVEFEDDRVSSIKKEINFSHSATYIDNPYIMDRLNQFLKVRGNLSILSELERDVYKKLSRDDESDIAAAAIAQVELESNLEEILAALDAVVPGKIEFDDKYVYETNDGIKLDVRALSTGLKSLAMIKQLILKKGLKKRDVLILDEPEIHLHPEWQLEYAKFIVLLQKKFDLDIVITTHSPHFLEAIDVYAKIYQVHDKSSYYLAKETEEGFGSFENVTDDLSPVFANLVSPNLRIDQIKAENGLTDDGDDL